MEVKDEIVNVLQKTLRAEYIRLDDDDGISGFIVSRDFEGMPTLERQQLIDKMLHDFKKTQVNEGQSPILMIAGITPSEYESVGARIRVHKIRTLGDGSLEVLLHGGYSDAVYVRGALNNQKGVQTTEPEQCPGAIGILMKFTAKGTSADPLTKDEAIRVLTADPYIQVMNDA